MTTAVRIAANRFTASGVDRRDREDPPRQEQPRDEERQDQVEDLSDDVELERLPALDLSAQHLEAGADR